MRFMTRALPLLVLISLASSARAVEAPPPEPLGVILVGTHLQPVPPIIDIGLVKPKRATVVQQTLSNECEIAIPVEAVAVVEGGDKFELLALELPGPNVQPTETFTLTVAATGEGSGLVTGKVQITWGAPYGTATLDLVAYVDLVDASIAELSLAQTGFESGSPAPFGLPLGLPAPQITGTAALNGEKGAAIVHTGSTAQSFYHYFFPAPRELARTSFRFDPNSLGIPLATPETIAGYYDWGLPIAWLEVRRNREAFQLRVSARLDNGTTGSSGWVSFPDAPQNLTFDWWAGQPGAFEGGVRVRCGPGCGTELRSAGLNFPRIRNVRAGAVSGVSSSVVGEWYLDELAVWF